MRANFRKILFFLLLLCFLVVPLVKFNVSGVTSKENRFLEVFPALPTSLEALREFPKQFERWFNDRIGLRERMIRLYKKGIVSIFGVSPVDALALGKNGTVFLIHGGPKAGIDNALGIFGAAEPWETTVKKNYDLLKANLEWKRQGEKKILFLAVPTSPIFRHDDLPRYMKMGIPQKNLASLPLSEALELFRADYPEEGNDFLFPLEDAWELSRAHPIYPQKNFHWTLSPFTMTVANRIAERLGHAPDMGAVKEFEPCETISDLSHLMGYEMINENDLCPNNIFMKDLHVRTYTAKSPPPGVPSVGKMEAATVYHNDRGQAARILVIGDSFNFSLGIPLARLFSDVMTLDYYALERQHGKRTGQMLENINQEYKPDIIVIIRHDIFLPAAWMPSLNTFLRDL